MKERNTDQDLLMSEYVSKSQLIMQNLGLFIGYHFALTPGVSNSKSPLGAIDWGLMRYDASVKPPLIAFATLSNTLAAADYLGSFDTVSGIRGFLFRQPDRSQTLALWRESALDKAAYVHVKYRHEGVTKVSIPQPSGKYLYRDVFGTPLTLTAANGRLTIPVGRQVCYISGIHGLKPAPNRGTASVPSGNSDRSVVINIVTGPDFSIPYIKLYTKMNKPSAELSLQIYNFSSQAKCGKLNFKGVKIVKEPGEVTIPAHGMTEIKLTVTPEIHKGEPFTEFHVDGTFNGKPVTSAVMPILVPQAITKTMPLPGADKSRNWKDSILCKMTRSDDPVEKAVVFKGEFSAPRGYIYPEFRLPPDKSYKDAVGLQFDMWIDPETGRKGFVDKRVSVGCEGEKIGALFTYDPPRDGTWRKIKIFFPYVVKNPSKLRRIRIGFMPYTLRVEYKIRNLELLMSGRK